MNAYYQKPNRTIIVTDNNPIAAGDRLIALICAIVAFFTSTVAIRIEKATLCTVGFVAFFGVIGSMDNGNVGMVGGAILCLAISFVEFLVFKSMAKKK